MPKNRKASKTASGAIVKNRPPHKFRIGTRKSGTSALVMSSKALLEVLTDSNKKKWRTNAIEVLKMRGIQVSVDQET